LTSDWDAATRPLASAPQVILRQGWADQPSPDYRPARVRVGYTKGALILLAELEDADIFNPATELNEPSFLRGDVLEMFLRPVTQDAYYEFHVSPQNQKFQLRIPSAAAFQKPPPDNGESRKLWNPMFESRVRVLSEQQKWQVLAAVPFRSVEESVAPGHEDVRWLFSFSRYDYTRGHEHPALSSTSPHPFASFHRQTEWGTLVFAGRRH
jgi:hypothetical protein